MDEYVSNLLVVAAFLAEAAAVKESAVSARNLMSRMLFVSRVKRGWDDVLIVEESNMRNKVFIRTRLTCVFVQTATTSGICAQP